jgi:hypothetical protein
MNGLGPTLAITTAKDPMVQLKEKFGTDITPLQYASRTERRDAYKSAIDDVNAAQMIKSKALDHSLPLLISQDYTPSKGATFEDYTAFLQAEYQFTKFLDAIRTKQEKTVTNVTLPPATENDDLQFQLDL